MKVSYSYSGLGYAYMRSGDYELAIDAYNKAIECDSNNSVFWSGLGLIYRLQGNIEKAIDAYKRAIAINSNYAIAHIALAACYRKSNNYTCCREETKIADKLAPGESEYNRACLAAIKGDVDGALEMLENASRKNEILKNWLPKDPDFDFIRNDPRFKKFLDEHRLAEAKGRRR